MSLAKIDTLHQTDQSDSQVHPPIDRITDALSFKVAKLSALNERNGGHHFKVKYGVTLNQWRILGLTCALGPVPSQQVRKILFMDKGQFSRVVNQLVGLEYIRTSPNRTDARVIELQMTRRGKVFHDKLLAFTMQRNEAAVSALTASECKEFIRLLDKLSKHNQKLQNDSGLIK